MTFGGTGTDSSSQRERYPLPQAASGGLYRGSPSAGLEHAAQVLTLTGSRTSATAQGAIMAPCGCSGGLWAAIQAAKVLSTPNRRDVRRGEPTPGHVWSSTRDSV